MLTADARETLRALVGVGAIMGGLAVGLGLLCLGLLLVTG